MKLLIGIFGSSRPGSSGEIEILVTGGKFINGQFYLSAVIRASDLSGNGFLSFVL